MTRERCRSFTWSGSASSSRYADPRTETKSAHVSGPPLQRRVMKEEEERHNREVEQLEEARRREAEEAALCVHNTGFVVAQRYRLLMYCSGGSRRRNAVRKLLTPSAETGSVKKSVSECRCAHTPRGHITRTCQRSHPCRPSFPNLPQTISSNRCVLLAHL